MVIWNQQDGDYSSMWANRYMVGEGWGIAATLIETNPGDASLVRVAVNESGDAMAIWKQDDGIYI